MAQNVKSFRDFRGWSHLIAGVRVLFLSDDLLLVHVVGLVEEEVGCELLVLVACKVGLNDEVSLESKAAELCQRLAGVKLCG